MFGILTMFALFAKENTSTIIFIAFTISIITVLIKNRKIIAKKNIKLTIIILFCIYFLIGVCGIIINSKSSTNYLTRLVPFIISPLILLYFNQIKLNQKKAFLKAFVLGNLLLLLVLDLWALKDIIANKSLFVIQGGREYYRFLYTRYTNPDYFNHIYLSLYSFLSGILLFQFNLTSNKTKWFLSGYFLIHLFMMGSRAIIISILFGAIFYLIVSSFINKKNIKYLVVFSTVIISLISTTYLFKDTLFFNRYAQVFEWYNNKDIILERNYSINNRIKIYMIGMSASVNHNGGIRGTGIADKVIKNTYELSFKDKFPLKTKTYNAHNQYINNFIDWGYVGVIALIWLLIIINKRCFKQHLFWVGYFWICFAILLLMESVLFRQRGILLFIIFYSLFTQYKTGFQLKSTKNE